MERKYSLGLYEKAMPSSLTWEEKLDFCKEAGFDFVEFSLDATKEKMSRLDWNDEQIKEVRQAISKTSVGFTSMNVSALRAYPLGSTELDISNKAVEILEKSIVLAYKLGIRLVQFAAYDVVEGDSTEETRKVFLNNLRKVVETCEKYSVVLSFETMNSGYVTNVTNAMEIVNKVNNPYLQFYPDLGNLINCSSYNPSYDGNNNVVVEDLKKARGHIVACHIKETNSRRERRIEFGSGDDFTQYEKHLMCLKELGCRIFMAEFWDNETDYRSRICGVSDFLRKKLDSVFEIDRQ